MARGTQFLALVQMLRNELGRAPSVAVGVEDVTRLKHHINRAYETRYDEYEWPHLRRTFDPVTLSAGQRYYDFPSELNYERVEKAWTWWTDRPVRIDRGITVDHYASYDSTDDERSDPAMRWDVRSIGNATQMEIWPVPASNDQRVTFSGFRTIAKLVNDTDVCLLDDLLVVLDAAAAIEKDADKRRVRAAEAERRFVQIGANAATGAEPARLNLGAADPDIFKGVKVIAARSE